MWGEAGPAAKLQSLLSPPPLVTELDDEDLRKSGRIREIPLTQRDMPYGWETLMENFVVSLFPVLQTSLFGHYA